MREHRRRRRERGAARTASMPIAIRSGEGAIRRHARITRWARHDAVWRAFDLTDVTEPVTELAEVLVLAEVLLTECASFAGIVRAELEQATERDEASHARLKQIATELAQLEQYGRVAILAAMLPATGRHDA